MRSFISEKILTSPSRDEKIAITRLIIVVSFFISAFILYYQNVFLKLDYPFNTFLPKAVIPGLGDYYGTIASWMLNGQFYSVHIGAGYFPATYLVANFFGQISVYAERLTAYSFVGLMLLTVFYYSYKNLRQSSKIDSLLSAFICTFLTYPVLFTLYTGNFEWIVFAALAVFASYYQRGETRIAAIALGFAIAMKLFPAVFIVIFLSDRKYRHFFMTIASAIAFTVIPLVIFRGGLWAGLGGYLQRLHDSQMIYFNLMIMDPQAGNHYGHSLLNAIRILAGPSFPPMAQVLLPYMLFTLVFFALASSYIILIENSYWKKIAVATICMCLLPYTSTDYKLMHLFIPFYLFINSTESNKRSGLILTVLFALLLVPKDFYRFADDPVNSINSVINTAAMLLIMIIVMVAGLSQAQSSEIKSRFLGLFKISP